MDVDSRQLPPPPARIQGTSPWLNPNPPKKNIRKKDGREGRAEMKTEVRLRPRAQCRACKNVRNKTTVVGKESKGQTARSQTKRFLTRGRNETIQQTGGGEVQVKHM